MCARVAAMQEQAWKQYTGEEHEDKRWDRRRAGAMWVTSCGARILRTWVAFDIIPLDMTFRTSRGISCQKLPGLKNSMLLPQWEDTERGGAHVWFGRPTWCCSLHSSWGVEGQLVQLRGDNDSRRLLV